MIEKRSESERFQDTTLLALKKDEGDPAKECGCSLEGDPAKECGCSLEGGKGKTTDSFLETFQGMQPCPHLNFSSMKSMLDF